MRKLTLAMIAVATLLALSVSPAHAGATCKIIPSSASGWRWWRRLAVRSGARDAGAVGGWCVCGGGGSQASEVGTLSGA